MTAVWMTDYDYQADKTYKRPGCPKCLVPIEKENGAYWCMSCGEEIAVNDSEMRQWLADTEGEKVKMRDCVFGCGGKGCAETHLYKNPVTLKWKVAWSACSKCGQKIIV